MTASEVILLCLLVMLIVGAVLWIRSHPDVKAEADRDLADLDVRVKAARDQATTVLGGIREWLRRLAGK